MKLYMIELSDWYLVAVEDGQDPLDTFIRHFPDALEPDDFPEYWSRDWCEDLSDHEIIDLLRPTVPVSEFEGTYGMDWDSCVKVSAEDLIRVAKHGDMWSERWIW